jgi:uncharacterized protein YkwD
MATTAAAAAAVNWIFRMKPPDDSNVGQSQRRHGASSWDAGDSNQATAPQSFAALVTRLTKRELSSLRDAVVSLAGRAEPYVLALATMVAVAACARSAGGVLASPPGPRPTSVTNYARLEAEVFTELNRARTDPRGYATIIEGLLPLYNGTLLRRPGWSTPLRTDEGASAAREAVSVLRAQASVGQLALSSGLSAAARDLVRDQGATGGTGHVGSTGSTTASRIAAHGTWTVTYAENIDYGPVIGGRDVIEDLLIDDGVPDRGHRHNIYQAPARVVGIACGPHRVYGSVCVIVQTGGFTAKP